MFQIDTSTAVATLPTPGAVGTPGYAGNGTIMSSDFFNMIQGELLSILAAAGVTPSKTTFNQVLTSLQTLFSPEYAAMAYKGTAYTIQVADAGTVFVEGAFAMTLPPATGLPADFPVTIYSASGGTTILPNGNPVILASGSTTSTITLPAVGDFLKLAWDATNAAWRVVGGSAVMLNAPLLSSWTKGGSTSITLPGATAAGGTVGSSGWSKDPNGLIRQWAYIQLTDSVNVTWTFPISFVSAPLKIRSSSNVIAAGQTAGIQEQLIASVATVPTSTAVQFVLHNSGTTGTLGAFLVEAEGY